MKLEDIEYGFAMAQGSGVQAMSTSTTLTMAKRIAPVADSHKLLVGYHGHDATNDPNQTATLESYDTLMAYGKYNGVNLDIGHFTAANYDAVAFIKAHHAKITNLHVKDMKKDHGTYTPFGEGDTPIRGVLQFAKEGEVRLPRQSRAGVPLSARVHPDRGDEEVPGLLPRMPALRVTSVAAAASDAGISRMKEVPEADLGAVGLQLDRALRDQRQLAVVEVVEHLVVHRLLAVEPDRHARADHLDAERIPLADRFVGLDQRPLAGLSGIVVP